MLEKYFNMRYCFDKQEVATRIDEQLQKEGSDYICVADGVVLNIANRDKEYHEGYRDRWRTPSRYGRFVEAGL